MFAATKALVFLAGDPPSRMRVAAHLQTPCQVICADGGVDAALAVGLVPDQVIGDHDSLSKAAKQYIHDHQIPTQLFPRDKDATDFELVWQFVMATNLAEIVIFGWWGDRADHVLANLQVLAAAKPTILVILVTAQETLYLVRQTVQLTGHPGERVSLIPLQVKVEGVTTTGLSWSLQSEALYPEHTRGVSNQLVANQATIQVRSGTLLVVHHH